MRGAEQVWIWKPPLNKSRFHETLKNKCVKSVNPSFADAQHLRPGRHVHQHHQRIISTSDEQIPELVENRPVQQFNLHVQTPSDEEADREVAAICKSSEQYRVRSHLRRRRRYLMYNALDDIGEITQYKRPRNNSPSVQ